VFFVARSTHQLTEVVLMRHTWLLRRPSARMNQLSVVPLFRSAFHVLTIFFSDNSQISNTGPMTGGVGATGVSSQAVSSGATTTRTGSSSTSRSGASGTSSMPRSSASRPSSTGASKPSSSSSPSYLVANDLFTLFFDRVLTESSLRISSRQWQKVC